jgi:rhamnopyranosyl-N-acetylglucosaminyl-diphospho-decaprenol beta-1,3/1,4-galactofuranosyltransferase
VKILAAVVTHNRSALLARCVDALRAQTRPADHILVINNASTDDTEPMLRARGVNFITQGNVGGAGGFNRAIAHALDHGFDAVWLMDDDGYPGSDALERLAGRLRPGVSCVSSVVLREDDPENFVFPFPVLDRAGFPVIFSRRRKLGSLAQLRARSPDGTYPFAHFFNGCLISVEAIRKVGNIETDYFIAGDEVDYLMRLRSAGAILSDLSAHHFHPDVTQRPLNEGKVYYYVKNSFILHRRYFNHPALRNILAVAAVLARTAARNGLGTALSFAVGRHSRVLRKAISRGLRGKIGNDLQG